MLISLKTDSIKQTSQNVFKLNFNMPTLILDDHKYTVALRSMIIDLTDVPPDLLISLTTTIIDRNALNPCQQLYTTVLTTLTGSNYIMCEPTLPLRYKIQTPNLCDSEFQKENWLIYVFNIFPVRSYKILHIL